MTQHSVRANWGAELQTQDRQRQRRARWGVIYGRLVPHYERTDAPLRHTAVEGVFMGKDVAAANVDRSYALAATSNGIFTFVLFFLYPLVASGKADGLLFQVVLVLLGLATFSFALASFYYYSASVGDRIESTERDRCSGRGDGLWLLGCVLLFFAPSLILFTIGVAVVACVWLALWLTCVFCLIRCVPRTRVKRESSGTYAPAEALRG